MTRVQATPTATATIHAANTIPFACLQRSARSFSHATDPAESPRRTTVAARLVGTICFCPVPPATINSCCFFCSFRSIHFCRSRGSIPKSSTLHCRRRGDNYDTKYTCARDKEEEEGDSPRRNLFTPHNQQINTGCTFYFWQFTPLLIEWIEHFLSVLYDITTLL